LQVLSDQKQARGNNGRVVDLTEAGDEIGYEIEGIEHIE